MTTSRARPPPASEDRAQAKSTGSTLSSRPSDRQERFGAASHAQPPGRAGEGWAGLRGEQPCHVEQDIWAERAALLRDLISEALEPVERDTLAARLCLGNDDDAGAGCHLKRIIAGVKTAARTFGARGGGQ